MTWHRCCKALPAQQHSSQCASTCVFSTALLSFCSVQQPPFSSLSLLPSLKKKKKKHPHHRPHSFPLPIPLSWAPGIFRYWSPHYSSIQPQQTHKQISCLRRSQSPSPSLLCCAIRPQHNPVRWARGKAYCKLQPPLAPPQNPFASQPRVTAGPNTIKSHLLNAQAYGIAECVWGVKLGNGMENKRLGALIQGKNIWGKTCGGRGVGHTLRGRNHSSDSGVQLHFFFRKLLVVKGSHWGDTRSNKKDYVK